MTKVVSEDAIRRAFKAIDEKDRAAWLRRHLAFCCGAVARRAVDRFASGCDAAPEWRLFKELGVGVDIPGEASLSGRQLTLADAKKAYGISGRIKGIGLTSSDLKVVVEVAKEQLLNKKNDRDPWLGQGRSLLLVEGHL